MSSSALGQIFLGLDEPSRFQVAVSLVPRIFSAENDPATAVTLSEILSNIYTSSKLNQESNWKSVITSLKAKFSDRLRQVTSEEETIQGLGRTISPLFRSIPDFHDLILESATESLDHGNDRNQLIIASYLNLLDELFIQVPVLKISSALENYLFYYLQSLKPLYASLASKVICHYILTVENVQSQLVWSNIKQSLELSKDQPVRSNRKGEAFNRLLATFRIWLRWVSRDDLQHQDYFMTLLNDNEYWQLLQQGLTSQSHDCKKYSLHILSRSIQIICQSNSNIEIDIEFMRYTPTNADKFLSAWKRYITLVEIVSIDTSINQTEDSVSDIINILSKESGIPPIWAISLLSAALTSSMEQIRKFVAGIILAMEVEDLTLFKHNPSFIREILLPYSVLSANFTTIETSEHNYSCPHAELVTQFVTRLLQSLENDDAKEMTRNILDFLYGNRLTFDPSRLYIVKGIRDGLKGREILTDDEIKKLFKLNTGTVESLFRKQSLYEMFVEIMLLADLKAVNFEIWVSYLSTFLITCSVHGDIYTGKVARYIKNYEKSDEYSRLLVSDDLQISLYLSVYLKLAALSDNEVNRTLENLTIRQLRDLCLSTYSDKSITLIFENYLPDVLRKLLGSSFSSAKMAPELSDILCCILKREGGFSNYEKYSWIVDSATTADLSFIHDLGLTTLETCLDLCILARNGKVNEIFMHLKETRGKQSQEDILTCAYILLTPQIDNNDFLLSNEAFSLYEQHFHSSGYKLRLSLCKFLYAMFKEIDQSTIERVSQQVISLSKSMWFNIVDERLMASERELHRNILRCIFNTRIVELNDEMSIETLQNIAESAIEQSYSRRGIITVLASFLVQQPNVLWIGKMLVSIYTNLQADYHMFRLENAIGKMNDNDYNSSVFISGSSHESYFEWYGEEEIAAKVKAIEYFSNYSNVVDTSEGIFNHIVNSTHYRLFNPLNRTDGKEELTRIRCYQILLILLKKLDIDFLLSFVRNKLVKALDKEALPLVKVYIEWIISEVVVRDLINTSGESQIADELIFGPLENITMEPRLVTSIERIGLIVGMALRKNLGQNIDLNFITEYYKKYFQSIVVLSTTNKVAIRHNSLSLIFGLQSILERDEQLKKILGDYRQVVDGITDIAHSLPALENYKIGEQCIWDLTDDFNLFGICGGVLRRVSERQVSAIKKDEFIRYICDEDRFNNTGENVSVPIFPSDISYPQFEPTIKAHSGPVTVSPAITLNKELSSNIQTKSGAWTTIIDDLEGEGRNVNINRGELIVLASLVDKPPNLGGICRLSDVLGAKLLCLNDITVAKHPQFKNVSVSADRWMPMKEVKESNIISYLREMKKEGYTLIGLEQTDNSIQLSPDLKFPRKSLLLLGRERLGIDGELLSELDFCVEIKQVGVIRSMNIQTATAVVVHAYSSQHC